MKLRGKGKQNGDDSGASSSEAPANPDANDASAAPAEDGSPDAADTDDATREETREELRDLWLRAVAEADNARKRARADLDEARRYGTTSLLLDLLSALDNLHRALSAPPEDIDPQFLQGLTLTAQQWTTVLANHGVQPVSAEIGEAFDPSVHRALLEQETDDYAPGHIVSEVLRGYRIHDRLLREAQVVVSKAPSAPADDDATHDDAPSDSAPKA